MADPNQGQIGTLHFSLLNALLRLWGIQGRTHEKYSLPPVYCQVLKSVSFEAKNHPF
jgi:hypothetical protein